MIFGMKRTLREAEKEKVKKIFLASNCSPEMEEQIKTAAEKCGCDVEKMKITNEEFGEKQGLDFPVSVAGEEGKPAGKKIVRKKTQKIKEETKKTEKKSSRKKK